MLSRIGLHPANKKAREMEVEIANAEENLAKMGIEVGGKKMAFLGSIHSSVTVLALEDERARRNSVK